MAKFATINSLTKLNASRLRNGECGFILTPYLHRNGRFDVWKESYPPFGFVIIIWYNRHKCTEGKKCLTKLHCGHSKNLEVGRRRKKTLFYGPDRPIFSDLGDFFFQFAKILTKIYQFYLKNVENKLEYFIKKFLQKKIIFKHVFRVIFAPEILRKKRPDQPTRLGRSVSP